MGGGTSKFVAPTGIKKDGNELIELHVRHIRDAHEVIGLTPDNYTPVVLIPDRFANRCCGVPCCNVSVPAGFTALVSKWGKDLHEGPDGSNDSAAGWEAGFHCLWPWYRINRLVTKQLIIFNAPVKSCKTKDNITVLIDVLIVFEIVDATMFVYKLGPENLDDLLRASQEEVVKGMAMGCTVEQIYDLAGAISETWVSGMNEKFLPYGVTIHHFTVQMVRIPENMAQDFEDKTLYESKTLEKQMLQESNRLKLGNDEEQASLRFQCDNRKMAAEEQAVTAKAQISKEVKEVEACTEKDIMVEAATREGQVADVETTANLEHETIKAQIMRMEREDRSKVECEVGKLSAKVESYVMSKDDEGKAKYAEKVAMGTIALVKAEGAASYAFASRRAQEQEFARLEVLEKMADNVQIKVVTTHENSTGLAPNNSLVAQVVQQGMEMLRLKMAEMTASSAQGLSLGRVNQGGLVRGMPGPSQLTMA